MRITKESLKWPQIDAVFNYIYDNNLYDENKCNAVLEFGTGHGNSTKKICDILKENEMESVWVFTFDSFDGLPYEEYGVEVFPKYTRGAYKLDKKDPAQYIKEKVDYFRLQVIHSDFETLSYYELPALWGKDFTEVIHPLFIHIDCDLYSSTRTVLSWLFKYKLIVDNLLIAYDEYQSTKSIYDGGESLAHYQAFRWNPQFSTEEVWHNIYTDKDTGIKIRQNIMQVVHTNNK